MQSAELRKEGGPRGAEPRERSDKNDNDEIGNGCMKVTLDLGETSFCYFNSIYSRCLSPFVLWCHGQLEVALNDLADFMAMGTTKQEVCDGAAELMKSMSRIIPRSSIHCNLLSASDFA
jgi:hypothetical protein